MRTIVRFLAVSAMLIAGLAPVASAEETYSVSGAVTTSGGAAAVEPVRLEVYSDCAASDARTPPVASKTLRDGPIFSLTLPPGTYRVRILQGDKRIESWHGAALTCAGSEPLNVTGDTEVILVASKVVTVSGVVDTPRGRLTDGFVTFYTDCAAYAQSTGVDDDGFPLGHYTARVPITYGLFTATLPSGRFRVHIQGETRSWHPAQQSCESAQEVAIDSDAPITLMANSLWTLTGSVTTRLGPADKGKVHFYSDCATAPAATGRLVDSAFTVKVLPGDYRIRFTPKGTLRLVDSWHSEKAACEQANLVTVTQDQSLQLSTLARQSIAMRSYRFVRKSKVVLPKKTREGARVTWRLVRSKKSQKVCKLRRSILIVKKQGSCRLKAAAPARPGLVAYTGAFEIAFSPKARKS